MGDGNFRVVEALHPHWRGTLRLSNFDNSAIHGEQGSRGTYEILGNALKVSWRDYSPDTFTKKSDLYVHDSIIDPELRDFSLLRAGGKLLQATKISVLVTEKNYKVNLRLNTSDIPTFYQVFVHDEYESQNLPSSADTIIDLGANIGLATIFFSAKYPRANILSVEPENGNFQALVDNVEDLGVQVKKLHAAAWFKDGFINLHIRGEDGNSLGEWGAQVSENSRPQSEKTRCCNVSTMMKESGFEFVDILKVDIEGAELEIFSQDYEGWISKVNLIIVETHDRFRPGSEEAVRRATRSRFEELPRSGENLFFRRRLT